jgi:signal transduction histidine kinase
MRSPREAFSLRSALIVVVLIPLLLVFGVGGYAVLTALETDLEARLQEDIELIARTLREPLARSLESRQDDSLYQAMRSTSEFNRVYGVYLYDSRGMLIARAGQRSATNMPDLTDLDVSSRQEAAEYGSVAGRRVYSYFAPLSNDSGRVIGMLQVTRRASEIGDYLDSLRGNAAAFMVAFCLLCIGIVTLGHHYAIGRPLRHLGQVMGRVSAGDDAVRADSRGPLEVRRLSGRFNRMLDDIAERDRVLAEERRRSRGLSNRLRESEQYALIGRLASGVAHELGGPLSVVDGEAQRLARRGSKNGPEIAMIAHIREAADRMAGILRRLLAFGRESVAPPKNVLLEHIVSLAVADIRGQSTKGAAEIQIVEGPPSAFVFADGGRLREALVHLLRNAVYAARGGLVRIGSVVHDSSPCVFVENSGKPLPTADRDRIFDPFFTTKAPGDGSGLGLAIVKGTVIDHDAEIAVYESELGGAGFRIAFPPQVRGM